MKKAIIIPLLIALFVSIGSLSAGAADDFSQVLATFPDSYKASLTQLHEAHPAWKFERISVGKNFSVCLNAEHNCKAKLNLVEVSASDSRACQNKDCANAAYHTVVDGVYRCASYDYIAECMDPTNFLRESLIFQFEDLGAKAYYTQDKLETALAATSSFMHNKTYRTSSKTYYYSKIILDACKANGVDALFIISRITNEVGSASPAKLATGYAYEYEKGKTKTVYNFFNIGGNVSASAAHAYKQNWTNPKAALEGGIKFIAQNYVKAGQTTNYFQKFQVNPACVYGFYNHQYMQGVDAVINESGYTFNNYSRLGILDKARVFKIPVYENLSKVSYEAQDLRFQSAGVSEKYAFVNAQVSSSLAVRTEPSTASGSVKCRITRSTLLQLNGKAGVWYKVKVLNGSYKNQTGYCHGDYISPAQSLKIAKGTSLTLKPKLRTSSCSYAVAFNEVSGAVMINKNGVASGKKIGAVIFKTSSSAGNTGYLVLECTGVIDAPEFTVAGGEKKIVINWKPVSDAKAYRIYSYNKSTKAYTRIAQTTALSYTVSSLSSGTEYSYLVRAVDVNGLCSSYTEASCRSARTLCAKPLPKLGAVSDTVTLSWKKVKGATQYGVWSYHTKTKTYKKLGNTTALSFKAPGLKANTAYSFLVRAYNPSGWNKYSTSDNFSITTAPSIPTLIAKGGEKQISLSWKKCAGASYYRLYRYDTKTKSYQKLAQTSSLGYTLKKLADGTEYIYLLRAFNAKGFGSSYTAKNHTKAITLCAKPTVTFTAATSAINLNWQKVKGASHYGVWSYDTVSGTYTKLSNTTALKYTVGNLKANTRCIFLVRSYNQSGWSKFTKADNKAVTTAPAAPKPTVKQAENGIRLSWQKCAGASAYRVYSFDPIHETYTRIATLKTTSYFDADATVGTHYYLIRAVNAAGSASDFTQANLVRIETV